MNKKILYFAFSLCLILSLVSCQTYDTGRINLYDTEEILNDGDSFTSKNYEKGDQELRLIEFSGTYTMKSFDLCTEVTIIIDWTIDKGSMRVLWITSDDQVIELEEGIHHFQIENGIHRLKMIGDKVSGRINWVIRY